MAPTPHPRTITLEIYDYLLQYGVHIDIANCTRHMVHYVKTRRHSPSQNWKYSVLCT